MSTTFDSECDDYVAVPTPSWDKLRIYTREGRVVTTFDLGPFRLFRPDLDSMYQSEGGRTWLPDVGPRPRS